MKKRMPMVMAGLILAGMLLITGVCDKMPGSVATAATSIKLNKTKTTAFIGKKRYLSVSGTKKKVTWSSSNRSIATVTSKGVVNGKKAGSAVIKAKVAGKTLKCKVTVKKLPARKQAVLNLKSYISTKGTANPIRGKDLKRTLKLSSSSTAVYSVRMNYDKESDVLKFYYNSSSGSVSAEIWLPEGKYVTLDYTGVCGDGMAQTRGTIPAATYTKKTSVSTVIRSYSGGLSKTKVRSQADTEIRRAFVCWDTVLDNVIGYDLSMLGFEKYHR